MNGFPFKPDDRLDDGPAAAVPDLQTLLIEQSELLLAIGSDVVQQLHVLDTVSDLIEVKRRMRVWAEEIHAHIVPAMATHEAISQTARSRGLMRVIYSSDDLGVR